MAGEGLQPAGHGRDRHERRGHERKREQPDQPERLHRFLVPDGQPGKGGDARDRHAEHGGQHDHGRGGAETVEEPEPDRVAYGDDDHDGGAERRERRGLRDDARHQEVDVAAGDADRDRAAEDEAEQQHEDHRLDHAEEDVSGHPVPPQEAALGEGERVAQPPADPVAQAGSPGRARYRRHDAALAVSVSSACRRRDPRRRPFGCSSSAAYPVSVRNTSSSDGRRSASPWLAMSAASSARTASISASDPRAPTPTLTTPVSGSACGSPSPIGLIAATASAARLRSGTVNSITSPPTRFFSSSDVPAAMTRPWSMTTISSASSSASSRYWVVSSSVVPPATSDLMMSHIPSRARGSSPVVGSSRNSTRGRPTRLAARSRRRCMPPE